MPMRASARARARLARTGRSGPPTSPVADVLAVDRDLAPVHGSRWLIMRSSVLLPEPLGPMIVTTSPRRRPDRCRASTSRPTWRRRISARRGTTTKAGGRRAIARGSPVERDVQTEVRYRTAAGAPRHLSDRRAAVGVGAALARPGQAQPQSRPNAEPCWRSSSISKRRSSTSWITAITLVITR